MSEKIDQIATVSTEYTNRIKFNQCYEMQDIFDKLYDQSHNGQHFTNLYDLIFSKNNVLLAYKNVKSTIASSAPDIDHKTIKDIDKLSLDQVVTKIYSIIHGNRGNYHPKPIRQRDSNTSSFMPYKSYKPRPIYRSYIWDQIIQQCIKQILDPICEAKFIDDSYGYRPNRSVEHALASTYKMLQNSHLTQVVEFGIDNFGHNVNHTKLIHQLWTIGIRDWKVLYLIKQMLKTPIKMPNGTIIYPKKGIYQCGRIFPLLINVVLNELDHWVNSQWRTHPMTRIRKPATRRSNGTISYYPSYEVMRKKKEIKEMYIIRYGDDFRIFCRTRNNAIRSKIAIVQWLKERLDLDVIPEETRVINTKKKAMHFLGFKIKIVPKGQKNVVQSFVSNDQKILIKRNLIQQARHIKKPRKGYKIWEEVSRYNLMVLKVQNYYKFATHINISASDWVFAIYTLFKGRLKERISQKGRKLTQFEQKRYGKSTMVRYETSTNEPIYPIGYIQTWHPLHKQKKINCYTPEGRQLLMKTSVDTLPLKLIQQFMSQHLHNRTIEYVNNRISKLCDQFGRCEVTGIKFSDINQIHCHHKIPKSKKGTDLYENLVLVLKEIHMLIHATNPDTIKKYKNLLNLDKTQLKKLNELRALVDNKSIK